ncbi:MAG: hypothetical protein ABI830_10045, partial [Pseudolabrys sp.]
KPANGDVAYFIRGKQRPIVLTMQSRDGGKTIAEIKVPPFAQAQTLEAGDDVFGLPKPKLIKSGGGTDSRPRTAYAHVPAGIDAVLAFYRREMTARKWKEETEGAVVEPDKVVLTFTSEQGKAVLKLEPKYDFTVVGIVQDVAKPKAEPAAQISVPAGRQTGGPAGDSIDAMLRQAQQMVRDATADVAAANKQQRVVQGVAQAPGPQEALKAAASNDAPVPVPEGADDVEFDGDDGKLEFSSQSSVASIAAFYRSAMKPLGFRESPSVINRPNMVVLNFNKGKDALNLTIMQMGAKAKVTADGSALKKSGGKSADAKPGDKPTQAATEDDLIAEESGGLPVPKRHTMATGEKTPFRRELNANVPLDLAAVLGFYRRELGKLNWKEETKGAVSAADKAVIAYTSPDGPAMLTLGRKDGETTVKLAVKDPGAAQKGGIAPKPGMTKIIFGNILDADSTITFNNKPIKIGANSGVKAPDGPTIDVAPGKYKYSIRVPGKPVQNDEVEVGADETWGMMVGPGGVLAMHVY